MPSDLDAQRLLRGPSFEALVKRKTLSQYVELGAAAAQYERQNLARIIGWGNGLWALRD